MARKLKSRARRDLAAEKRAAAAVVRAALRAAMLEKARVEERDPDTGGDTGPLIRQGRDVEVADVADPNQQHDPSAHADATVRVRRVVDVLVYERACRRSITWRHHDAAIRLLDDFETGSEGGTQPRTGNGQSSGEYDSEQRRLDALARFLVARDAVLRANKHHDVVMWIVLKNQTVKTAAAFYHRDEAEVRGLLGTGLEALAAWYDALAERRRVA